MPRSVSAAFKWPTRGRHFLLSLCDAQFLLSFVIGSVLFLAPRRSISSIKVAFCSTRPFLYC